jgi:hypothetical protein
MNHNGLENMHHEDHKEILCLRVIANQPARSTLTLDDEGWDEET